ncbi:mitochondrial 50S ribosomal protein L22 [Panus rudis PR-1116 ss-1]|nr:mitochondrial 50S ribosomal protein L22 [Panus rudis PR-1116 ss-1]
MQSAASSLRRAAASSSRLLSSPTSYSRTALQQCQWNSQRYASFKSPLGWIKESLSMGTREKSSEEEVAAARKEQIEKGQASVFETIAPAVESESIEEGTATLKKKHTQHKYSTANFKISHRKLNMLGRQIAGKPVDSAILQMAFSEKRASKRIKSMLVVAKDHAKVKGLDEKKLVVAEAWVTKGPKQHKRFEPRGRGHFGIRVHPDSKLSVVLKEGKTRAELKEELRQKRLKRIVSAGYVREDVPLRNVGPGWAW